MVGKKLQKKDKKFFEILLDSTVITVVYFLA